MRLIIQLFIFVLCLNSAFSTLSSAHKFAQANSELRENSLVICTGSQLKVISSYHYFELGQIVELQSSQQDIDIEALSCPLGDALEPNAIFVAIENTLNAQKLSFTRLYVSLKQSYLSSVRYNIAVSRAPPSSH